MLTTLRRVAGAAVLCLGLTAGAASVGIASAQAAGGGSSPTVHGTSTTPGTQVRGEKFTKYCVSHYKPGSTVKVVDKMTGRTVYIHTDSHGHGCTQVPVSTGCQDIVASGDDTDGDTQTSTSTVCVLGETVSRSNAGALAFTGSDIIVPGSLIGLGLLAAGGAAVAVSRRRRSSVSV